MFTIIELQMITIEEINGLIAAENYKPKHSKEWIEVREKMFVHTRGTNPGEILTKRRPNEDPDVQKYRLSIYEPITKGSMTRAIDKLYRIFQNANFSIQVSDELSVYLNEKKFDNQFFYSFIQKFIVPRMIEDPNAWLVWIPKGEGLTNPSQKVEVEPVLIDSNEIKFLSKDAISWEDEDAKIQLPQNISSRGAA